MTAPTAGDVHVWAVALASEPDESTLTERERARFADLDDEARGQLAGTRAALRSLLGAYLDMPPRDVPLVYRGKPRLAGGELEFSVTHSGELALIAVARVPLGVDVELLETIDGDEFPDLVAFVLDPREQTELMALPENERIAAYYRVWTRKEAYIKATGEGLTGRPLPEVVVGVTEPTLRAVAGVPAEELARWTLLDVPVPAEYAAALVVREQQPRVAVRAWPE